MTCLNTRPDPGDHTQPAGADPITWGLKDAADASGLSVSTLYRHAAAGRLRLVKVGSRTLVVAASLRALLGVGA
jgi:hypothetical protein